MFLAPGGQLLTALPQLERRVEAQARLGADAARGAAVAVEQGATVIAQDEATSVVYGMPKAVDDAGLSDESLPLTELAAKIVAYTKSSLRH